MFAFSNSQQLTMSFQVSTNSIPSPISKPASVIRKTANFSPSIWGDRFATYEAEDKVSVDYKEQRIKELKEEVKTELLGAVMPSKQLKLIDAIQRLGVEYHFEKEIEEALQHIYHEEIHDVHNNLDNDLYNVALRFRLLRQQGHNVSCDIFNEFKDDTGNFRESLIEDTLGMLSLYEAAHLRKHEEDILDEALAFTSSHLQLVKIQLSNPLATQVNHALKRPIRKGLPRLEARYYMSIYQEIDSHYNEALLKLAKMDFNLLQSMHKKELCDVTKWWKDLDIATNIPYTRDRIVELYFWMLGVCFEPQYSFARTIMTKVSAMISIIDDTYDVYGTYEELELFTKAVERWDIDSKDQLPTYMKFIYQVLLDVYEEIEKEMDKEGRSYRFPYAKEAMKKQVKSYFVEAQWYHKGHVPTMEEYMEIGLTSCGYHLLATTCFVGMGEIVTKEAFDWVFNVPIPKIVRASQTISRLMDDMVSHKFEKKRGHVVSAVECYMKQYGVVEEQVVYDEFQKEVVNAWKDLNEECLNPTKVPMPLLTRILNFARVMDVLYKDEDGYTHVGKHTRDRITVLLIDHVPI